MQIRTPKTVSKIAISTSSMLPPRTAFFFSLVPPIPAEDRALCEAGEEPLRSIPVERASLYALGLLMNSCLGGASPEPLQGKTFSEPKIFRFFAPPKWFARALTLTCSTSGSNGTR